MVLRAHFIVILQLIIGLMGHYIWKNASKCFHQDHDHATFGHKILTRGPLIILQVGAHASFLFMRFFLGKDPTVLGYSSFVCFGVLFQLAFCLLTINSVHYLFKKCLGAGSSSKRQNKLDKLFSHRYRFTISVIYAISLGLYGIYQGAQDPVVKRVSIPIHKLDQNFSGFKIVQISDIHLGPVVGKSRLEKIASKVNELKPDLVVMTGDLVDGSVASLKEAAKPAQDIFAPHGKYFISGNHEYYTGDVDNWFGELQRLGFTVLHNSNVKIQTGGATLCLAGTDDIESERLRYGDHGMDLDKALSSCEQEKPIILLAHQPWAALRALRSQYKVDVVLSGHTHAGQMFPLQIFAYLYNPFFAGLYKYGEHSHVYVSQGTVFANIPMRVWSQMEISEIVLTAM